MAQKIEKNESGEAGQEAPIRETDTHFHVGAFKIAKKGLDKKTHSAIHDHLFKGGKVKGYQGGGPIVASSFDPSTGPIPAPGTTAVEPAVRGALAPFAQVPEALAVGLGGEPPAAPAAAPVAVSPAAPVAPSLISNVPPGTPAEGGALAPPAPPVPPTPPAAPQDPMAALMAKYNPVGTYMAGQRQAEQVLAEKAKDVQYFMTERAKIQDQRSVALAGAQQEVEKLVGQYRALGDNLMASTLANPIRADRYLANQSNGQRIAGAIGLILSGMGSGVTGQPNLAMQVINNAIARDIDEQKANLATKQSLMSFLMQRTNNELQARMLSNGMLQQVYGAKLDAVADQMGGMTQAADIRAQAATLKMNGAQAISMFQRNAMDMAAAKINLDASFRHFQLVGRLMTTGRLTAAEAIGLSPEEREHIMMVPQVVKTMDPSTGQQKTGANGLPEYHIDQTIGWTMDKTGKGDVEQQLGNIQAAKLELGNILRIASQMPRGSVNPTEIARAAAAAATATKSLGPVLFTEQKYYKPVLEELDSLISKPSKIWEANWDKPRAQVEELMRAVLTREQALSHAHYVVPVPEGGWGMR